MKSKELKWVHGEEFVLESQRPIDERNMCRR